MNQEISRVFEHFEKIASIPHCSKEAEGLRDHLVDFARRQGYGVEVDPAGNILAKKGHPRLCLQAHYDMVCVGRAPEIETVEEKGWLKAVDSSLGADNGIAVAMMMALMEEGVEAEFLWTADEEVGLIGAKALEFRFESPYLLNLDNEMEGVILIGCAGGVDLVAGKADCPRAEKKLPAWRVEVSGLPGGHSGVDIDKKIPNAIKVLAQYLLKSDAKLVSFEGGERRNSIPVHAEAVVRCSELPTPEEKGIHIERLENEVRGVLEESETLLRFLATAPHGVVKAHGELGIPESSLNLARVELGVECRIEYSLRAMSDEELEALAQRMEGMLERYGFEVRREEAYPAWKPEINDFTRAVAEVMERHFDSVRIRAIHAGLECGILAQKYPQLKMASIGPTIEHPHSTRERVKIASVKRTYKLLRELVASFSE